MENNEDFFVPGNYFFPYTNHPSRKSTSAIWREGTRAPYSILLAFATSQAWLSIALTTGETIDVIAQLSLESFHMCLLFARNCHANTTKIYIFDFIMFF